MAEMMAARIGANASEVTHFFGLVTRNIEPHDWRSRAQRRARLQGQRCSPWSMVDNGVWDLDEVAEWSDVRVKDPKAEVLGAKLLIGI